MNVQRIRVKLKSYDHRVIDEASAKIIDTAMASGAAVVGPIPLPTKRTLIPPLESTFKHKDAQEHFEVLVHKRLIDIHDPTPRTIDQLSNLDLPAGVNIEIKM
jgi:small subunit ribosomal protein S10